MTREEAIYRLGWLTATTNDPKDLEAIKMAREALSDEAVEVVRCKDCKWWSGSANTSHNNHLCKRALDQNVDYWTRGDDYCSYGERKGGDDE